MELNARTQTERQPIPLAATACGGGKDDPDPAAFEQVAIRLHSLGMNNREPRCSRRQVPLLRPAKEPAVKQALPDTDRLGYYSRAYLVTGSSSFFCDFWCALSTSSLVVDAYCRQVSS